MSGEHHAAHGNDDRARTGHGRNLQCGCTPPCGRRCWTSIGRCNIRNYTIFLREPENILFGTFEYHGTDFEADMARMAADPKNQEWWRLTIPCQRPLVIPQGGRIVASMQQVFHLD